MNTAWTASLLAGEALWLGVVFLPLLTACAFLVRRWRAPLLNLAPATALPAFLLAATAPPGHGVAPSWLVLGTRLGMDPTAKVFLFVTALLWLVAGCYARSYLRGGEERVRFFLYYLPAMTGNFGLILARDVVSFYTFFSLMSFAAYGLVVHDGTPYARRAGKVYITLVVVGEALVFVGLLLLAGAARSIYLADVPGALAGSPRRGLIVGVLLLGFGIKAGALPLHVWLPLAHPAAPTPASAVLSGAMIKAGLLGWVRFLPLGEMAMPLGGVVVVGLGLTAAFGAVLIGLAQDHPKTVLAYSSISQMGLITLPIGIVLAVPEAWPYAWSAILIAAAHHALAKSTLFLSVGAAAEQIAGTWGRRLRYAGLVLPALVLSGLPFSSGAVAKRAIKGAAKAAHGPWPELLALLLPLAAVGTTLLMARFLWITRPGRAENPEPLRRGDLATWTFSVICVALAPYLLRSKVFAGVHVPGQAALFSWSALWPILAGASLAGLAITRSRRKPFSIPEGDVLVLYLQAIRWLRAVLPAGIISALGREESAAVAFWRPREVVRRLGARLGAWELRLTRWTVCGALLLACVTAVFLLLVLP